MPKSKGLENTFDAKRKGDTVILGGLHYSMTVDEAVNLTAHLAKLLEDKREALEKSMEALER